MRYYAFTIGFSLLLVAGCATQGDTAASSVRGIPRVRWSLPVNGLAIGIEQQDTILLPRGESHHNDVTFGVLLRNCAAEEIVWSDGRGNWSVYWSGPEFPTHSPPLAGPLFKPGAGNAHRLAPGAETTVQIPIVWAFETLFYPRLPEGNYTFAAHYNPQQNPERDVPGFWQGKLSTPPTPVQIRHRR